ncbi:MAG TPA: SWIM zinc finger family protein [Bryobacteraceae bacterium]|nr:SWIM zinc finger family protein [Bryobacteraceae bacterium]
MNERGGRGRNNKGRGFGRRKFFRPKKGGKPAGEAGAAAPDSSAESVSTPAATQPPPLAAHAADDAARKNGSGNRGRRQGPAPRNARNGQRQTRGKNAFSPYGRQPQRASGIRAQSKGGKFGENWWARRWIEVLEGFDMGSRLNRGREYAKKGHVLSIQIEEGQVIARVQGSRPKPYDIDVQIHTLPDADWEKIAGRLAEQAVFSARLLTGEMPADIEEIFEEEGLSLYPAAEGDLQAKCTCPDTANPCKHCAAVYLLLGEEFDRDPFLLFTLRGMRREKLLAMIEKKLPQLAAVEGEHRNGDTVEEKPEDPKQPLPVDPDTFWKGAFRLPEEVMGDVTPPPTSCALPRRLGPFPFWQGQKPLLDALEPIYKKASQHAVVFLLGEPLS